MTADHKDAWNVANHRAANSNLARAYIEAIRVIRLLDFKVQIESAKLPPADVERIRILAAACEGKE